MYAVNHEYEDKEKEPLQRLEIGLIVPAFKTLISEFTDIEDENILVMLRELENLDISMESTWLAEIDTSMRSLKLDDCVDEDEHDQNGINLDNLHESDEFLDEIMEEEDFFKVYSHCIFPLKNIHRSYQKTRMKHPQRT